MIDEIQVENLALIRQAHLVPAGTLTVITGETGAGKSILLSALKLLMGGRADRDVVRDGQNELEVQGRFFGCRTTEDDDGAWDMPGTDCNGEVVVSRRVTSKGRSRASINGRMVSAGEVARVVGTTIDLCSQHEYLQLMNTSTHTSLLDAWAKETIDEPKHIYEQAFFCMRAAQAELERIRLARRASALQLDQARFDLRRIDEVNPGEEEYEQLKENLSKAEHAESLVAATHTAHEALTGEAGALDGLGGAIAALDDAARYDAHLLGYVQSLRDVSYVVEDVSRDIRQWCLDVDFDPATLAAQQERIAALQGLLRAYGPRMEDVLARRARAAALLAVVDDAARCEREAQQNLDSAREALKDAASALDKARKSAAPAFAAAVTKQMDRLEMGGAKLTCSFEERDFSSWTKEGPASLEFQFCAGAGVQPRPFARIASGGEVSRVMLALKVVLGARDVVDTLVFDEIDAGIGGSSAAALAEVISDLACTHQVIVVTHLPQVAVRGQVHYAISKSTGPTGAPETILRRLTDKERPAEIARMLSGDVNEISLAHAREMLEGAHHNQTGKPADKKACAQSGETA